jgi:hypothetical protein
MLAIPELQKPMGVWCPHVIIGQGCSIYEHRPHPCRAFECLWKTTDMDEHWKPDQSNMVVAGDETGTLLSILVDAGHSGAWTSEPYYSDIKRWSALRRWRVQVLTEKHGWVIFPEEDLFVGERKVDDEIVGYGYKQHGNTVQPAVSVRHGDGTVTDVLGGHYSV